METKPHKGRGAVSNREGRFEAINLEPFDDGWASLDQEDRPVPTTSVTLDFNRTIVTRNTSPDIPFEVSVNPYKGCEHGCIYCYARPSHAYLGLSPGIDFETKILAKDNAAGLLEQELRRKNYRIKPITLGANTDPYQPVERTWKVSRSILEVLHAYQHPVAIITKSALILRDLELLAEMAGQGLAMVAVSITSLDPGLCRLMEPRAAAPHRRLEVVRALTQAGIPTSVNAAPMIPGLNDAALESILEAAADAGAWSSAYIMIRLPGEVAGLFQEWLETHFPQRAAHVMSLIRQTRDGKEYDSRFGFRMRGTGQYADLLHRRFQLCRRRLGLNRPFPELRCDLFKPPAKAGDQLSLF